jgi:hypothetical protein
MKTLEISLHILDKIVNLDKKLHAEDKEPDKAEEGSSVENNKKWFNSADKLELSRLMERLPLNQKQELTAIVWMGTKNFEDFESAFKQATTFDEEGTIEYLSGKPLYEYIPDGVNALKSEGISINK